MGEDKKTPANENVWYLLATAYGGNHKKNQRIWNSWFCRCYSPKEKAILSKEIDCDIDDFLPWSEEETQHIEAVFNNAIREGSTIPNADEFIDFRHLVFEGNVDFSRFIFTSKVLFSEADFKGTARFSHSVFMHNTCFRGTHFAQHVTFENTCFDAAVELPNSHPLNSNKLKPLRARGQVNFSNAIFEKMVSFNSTKFKANAFFTNVKFIQDAYFIKTDFWSVGFIEANFSSRAFFDEAVFRDAVVFSRCDFDHPTRFYQTKFIDGYPQFDSTFLHQNTIFSAQNEFWPAKDYLNGKNPSKDDLVHAKETCAKIRHLLASNGLSSDAHFFFRREMALESQESTCSAKIPLLLYGTFSDYGYSIRKPSGWLLFIFFFGALVFGFYFLNIHPLTPYKEIIDLIYAATAMSFTNVFPIFGLRELLVDGDAVGPLPICLKVFSAFQTVVSLPLIFLFGLGVRNRFRLR
ncbi:MAG: pentapeptide repeat-containing protein [Amylibacter sp.]|nr:pentapeptide repeat-containing protein [Amylibacter sp.]